MTLADPAPGWQRSLAGAVVGCATGVSALLMYTNGLFVAGLAQDFGLTRVQFGFGVLLVTMTLAFANPVVGWLVDRVGAKWLSVAGLLLLSAGLRLARPNLKPDSGFSVMVFSLLLTPANERR